LIRGRTAQARSDSGWQYFNRPRHGIHACNFRSRNQTPLRIIRPLRSRPSQRTDIEAGASFTTAGIGLPIALQPCMFIARLPRWIGEASSQDEWEKRHWTVTMSLSAIRVEERARLAAYKKVVADAF
jgi:hypothetical protein